MNKNVHSYKINFQKLVEDFTYLNIYKNYSYTKSISGNIYRVFDPSLFDKEQVLWTVINEVKKDFKGFKPKSSDIETIYNVAFDFDSPSYPEEAILFAADALSIFEKNNLSPKNVPILHTGGGSRFILNIRGIQNSVSITKALEIIFKEVYLPLLENVAKKYPSVIIDSVYDPSRVFALSGTYRPSSKKEDANHLKEGFIRHYETQPIRNEFEPLRDLILDTSKKCQEKITRTEKQKNTSVKKIKRKEEDSSFSTMIREIEENEIQNLSKNIIRQKKLSVHKDRSVAFSIVFNTLCKKKVLEFHDLEKGCAYVSRNAHIIDEICGSKYGEYVYKNAKRLIDTFEDPKTYSKSAYEQKKLEVRAQKKLEKTKISKKRQPRSYTHWQYRKLSSFLKKYAKEDIEVPTRVLYESFLSSISSYMSIQTFSKLLSMMGYKSKLKSIKGKKVKCVMVTANFQQKMYQNSVFHFSTVLISSTSTIIINVSYMCFLSFHPP